MKQFFLKRMAIAAIALCAAPVTLLAQDKEKEKVKDKKGHQQIIITRNGDKDEKTVIEIDGDKVKVNGKDVADLKDIQVHINDWKMPNITRMRTSGQGNAFSMFDDIDHKGFFKVDSNRAMLGINTDGHDKGAEIESVVAGSGAEKAGLKKGDVITKIDNRKIDAAEDVTDAVRAHKPGDKITITYLRENKENKATAELGRWKGIDVRGMTAPRILNDQVWRESQPDRTFDRTYPSVQGNLFFNANRPKLGLSVQDTDDGKGVKVLEMDEEGNAAKGGIKEDDIITHIDDKAVNSADEIARLMKEKKDQPVVRFQVNRSGKTQNIEVKIPRKLKTADL